MQTELITGNTYPVKEEIKTLGGRWDKAAQGWRVPTANAAKARELVAAAGPAEPRGNYARSYGGGRSRYRSTYTRFAGGAEHYQNARGRCEDAPCCGCCS